MGCHQEKLICDSIENKQMSVSPQMFKQVSVKILNKRGKFCQNIQKSVIRRKKEAIFFEVLFSNF